MKVVIHCQPTIGWQGPFAQKFAEGLGAIGIQSLQTSCRHRVSDVAIVLGTTLWRDIEATGDYLLVDRCSFGDTNQYVSLVWNGHGRRGDHKVPSGRDDSRWKKHAVELKPLRSGSRRVLCGQTASYCARDLHEWYRSMRATHFRRHPAGDNPTGLPEHNSFDDCELVTLNSSVAVQGIIEGLKVEVHDEGGMAYGYHDRLELMHWLAWTQWHHEEIRDGHSIAHLFEG